jgi:hypothetical protein
MAGNFGEPLIVTDGNWMHIPVTRVYHRHYPEVRGEGRSLGEASRQLARLLTRGLDRTHGAEREEMERVIAAVRAIRPAGARAPRPPMAVSL